MQSIQLISHVNTQGILHIQLPFELANQEVEIILNPTSSNLIKERPIGLSKGVFEIPESFFDPLPEEIITAFKGQL